MSRYFGVFDRPEADGRRILGALAKIWLGKNRLCISFQEVRNGVETADTGSMDVNSISNLSNTYIQSLFSNPAAAGSTSVATAGTQSSAATSTENSNLQLSDRKST